MDWYQSIEFAHYYIHGQAVFTREFGLHLRHPLLAFLLTIPLKLGEVVAVDSPLVKIFTIQLFVGALDLVLIWGFYTLLRDVKSSLTRDSRLLTVAMAYVVCHWAWLSDSISPSIEHVSVVALFLSLGLLTRHRYVLAGVSAMGIAALRYLSGIFTLAILTALSIRTLRGEMTPRALVRFLVGLTVGTRLWMHRPARWLAKVASLFLPFALLGSSLAAVTLVNYVYYSERSVTETKQPEFVAAMGALMRVSHERWAPFVVVPAEVREDVYRESPTFALLRPHLEAHAEVGLGLGARRRLGIDGDPRYAQEIPGGWFMWSLRDAVARMGFYSYAPDARRFYRRLTDEINAACAAGRLACGPAPATLAPPWRREYLPSMARALWRGTKDLLLMTEHPVLSELRSTGPTPALAMVADLTGDRLRPTLDEQGADASRAPASRLSVLGWIAAAYRATIPLLATLAALTWLVNVTCRRFRRWTPLKTCAGAIFLGIWMLMFLLAYIDVSSFPAFPGFMSAYMAPLTPLVLAFTACSLLDAAGLTVVARDELPAAEARPEFVTAAPAAVPVPRWWPGATATGCGVLGAAVAVTLVLSLTSYPVPAAVRVRGFHQPPETIDGQVVQWSREVSKVEFDWLTYRPVSIRMTLRAPPETSSSTVNGEILVRETTIPFVVGQTPTTFEHVVEDVDPLPLELRIESETVGPAHRGVGIGNVVVRPAGISRGAVTSGVTGLILGLMLWVALPPARAFRATIRARLSGPSSLSP